MKLKKIKTREQAWEACLALWKELSEMPPGPGAKDHEEFKNGIFEKLGYDYVTYGCPFCHLYNKSSSASCPGCPVSEDSSLNIPDRRSKSRYKHCFYSSYAKWQDTLINPPKRHHPSKAKRFFEYLLKLKEEDDA